MVNAGVSIMEALEILFKSEKNPALKKTIREISSDVGHGKTIASAMENQKGFSKLYCSLVKAGESAGVLDVILDKLASHLDNQEKTKKKIKSALTYPIAVMIIGTLVVWDAFTFCCSAICGSTCLNRSRTSFYYKLCDGYFRVFGRMVRDDIFMDNGNFYFYQSVSREYGVG